jgi:nucleoside-diphosphate-sugar epimerase
MKRVLITGANGFLGRNLVEYFLKTDCKILAISRNFNNIKDILNKISFIQVENNQYNSIVSDILKFEPDIVIHAAWSGGNSYKNSNSLDQFSENIPQSNFLLKILKPNSIFMGIGSFAEYGELNCKAEESQIENPTTFYGLSKLNFKEISKLYCSQNSIRWKWIRPCYIYGPGDVQTRLIPSVINKFLNKQPVNLDRCEVLIDYLYIDDFCEAILAITESSMDGIYNVCSGLEYNLQDVIKNIHDIMGRPSPLTFNCFASRELSSSYICGNNEKLKTHSSWLPKIDLRCGLIKTIH